MTAKEIQKELIKSYLKPTLKNAGYLTSGQTWWQDKGDFFTLINLQNYSWNNKNSVDFCFNIGIALKANMKDLTKKPTVHDLTVNLREGFYLSEKRRKHRFRNNSGYVLTDKDDFEKFNNELKIDFEENIIPFLLDLNTIRDCVDKFGEVVFWGDNLKLILREKNIEI